MSEVRIYVRVLVALIFLMSIPAFAGTTAFTYQGKLTDSAGQPANGSYTMLFRLFDAATGGSQIGTTITKTSVAVSGGLFAAELDFTATAFSAGLDRWLEVVVGTQTLSPRMKITTVPRAVYAQSVPWSGVTGVPQSMPPSGTAGGELYGSYPAPTIRNDVIDRDNLKVDPYSLYKVSGGAMKSSGSGIGIGDVPTLDGPLQIYGSTYAIDQQQTTYPTSMSFAHQIWQSFTAGATGYLAAVELYIGEAPGYSWSGTLSIYAGEGTTGTLLCTQNITGRECTLRTVPLVSYPWLTQGNVYSIAVHPSGWTQWKCASNNPYPGGSFGTGSQYDAYFRTLMKADTVPALVVRPATLNVGIGTATPGYPLSFADTNGDKISLWGNSANHYGFGIQPALLQVYADGSGSDIAFGYGSSASFTETMRIKNNGKVGVGTSSPEDALAINGALRVDQNSLNGNTLGPGAIRFGGGATGEGIACNRSNGTAGENQWGLDFYTSSNRRMSISLGGNVGINTTNPQYKLHVNGSVAGVGAYNQLSDARFKTNIQEIPNALNKVEGLRGVTFDWRKADHPEIEFTDGRQIGLIAQEVEKILPEAVTKDSDGNYSVSYSSLVPLLIEAMKEQQETIERLESRLEKLESRAE